MAGCCDPRGYDEVFDTGSARHDSERYRARGLSRTARRIVELVAQGGVRGASVLEIGGGIGDLQIELLKRGAAWATNLELSPAYDAEARWLLVDAGLTGRAERRLVDIAVDPAAVEPADVVVLNRVVCCYPDFARLLGAAADRARRQLVFSYPSRGPVARTFLGGVNLGCRISRCPFRLFAHPPAAMLAVLAEHGLRQVAPTQGRVWRVTALAR